MTFEPRRFQIKLVGQDLRRSDSASRSAGPSPTCVWGGRSSEAGTRPPTIRRSFAAETHLPCASALLPPRTATAPRPFDRNVAADPRVAAHDPKDTRLRRLSPANLPVAAEAFEASAFGGQPPDLNGMLSKIGS